MSNLRLFVAAYPPIELARRLVQRAGAMALPPHKLTREDQVHLTLQFIGDTPSREIDAVVESVRRSAAGIGPITLAVSGLEAFPPRGPARLIAARTDAPPPLLELHRRLAHRLATNVRERAGDRFEPHMTVARLATPADERPAPVAVDDGAFTIERIVLMRSVLAPAGAEHRPVESVELVD